MSKSEQSSASPTPYSHPGLQPDCDAARDLIPAYAFGLADADEAALVEASLPHCPDLVAELESYTALAAPMAVTVPQIAPPPSLYGKLMSAAEQSRPSVAAAGGLSSTVPTASTESGVRTAPSAATTAPTPSNVTPFPAPNQSGSRGGRLLVFVAAAAAVLALFALNVLVLTNALSSQGQLTERLEAQTAMLTLFAQDEVLEFELRDPQNADNPTRAIVLCHPEETVAVLRAENFPQAEDSYPVWLWDSGKRIKGGTLNIGEDGRGTLVLEAPLPMKNYDYIGIGQSITVEQPQTMLRGALYPTDEVPPTPTP